MTEQAVRPLSREEREVITRLRHDGFAVLVWYPEELGEANPRRVEDRLIELGHQVIEDLQ